MCLKESFKHYQALVKYKHKCTHLTATFWKIKRWNLTLAPFPLKRASASVVPEHSAIDVPFYGIQLAGIYPDCSTKFLVPSHCLILVLVGQGFIYKASADSLQLSNQSLGQTITLTEQVLKTSRSGMNKRFMQRFERGWKYLALTAPRTGMAEEGAASSTKSMCHLHGTYTKSVGLGTNLHSSMQLIGWH